MKSPLITDENLMHSYLEIDSYSDDLSLSTSIEVYEDKSKLDNDKYEFIYPNYNLVKDFNDIDSDGKFSLNSYGFIKKYDTNVEEKNLINDFSYNSYLKKLPGGFTTITLIYLKIVTLTLINLPAIKRVWIISLMVLLIIKHHSPYLKKVKII